MLPPEEPTYHQHTLRKGSTQLRYSYPPAQPRELLVPEILYVLRRRRAVIAGSALLGLLLAIAYVLLRAPRYEAQSQIEISASNPDDIGLEDPAAKALNANDSTVRLQSAVEVLQSNSLALEVIDQLGLAHNRTFAGSWRQPENASRSAWSPEVRDHLCRAFREALTVELVPRTDIIAITFRSKSPDLSTAVANELVQKFRERSLRTSYESANQVSEWLSKQLEDLKSKARSSQEQLATLERTSGLLGQDQTDNIVFAKLRQLDEQLTAMESDRIVKEARYRVAATGDPELLATSAPDATLEVLRAQQASLHAQYVQLNSKFGPGYPKLAEMAEQVSKADAAVDRELSQLAERYRNDYQAALRSEQMLRASFEAQKQKAYRLNEDAAQHAILKREVESTQQLYETLQLKLKEAGIAAGLSSANIGVVDAAQLPSQPSDPKPFSAIPIGLGAGLVCGAALAIALESADDSVRSLEEAEEAAGLPTLGAIPYIGGCRTGSPRKDNSQNPASGGGGLLLNTNSRAAESYRAACQSLLLTSREQAPKVIAIASALPLEGKTTTAINCAVALAQRGAKVLLVDADLRQPSIHESFGLDGKRGLKDQIAGTYIEELACPIPQQPGLWVLSAGTSEVGKAAVLDSNALLPLIKEWRSSYDYVILDTPPLSLVSDALVLATHSDAVVLVVRSDVTPQRLLRRTCDTLQRAHVNPVGLVFNGVAESFWYSSSRAGLRRKASGFYYADDYRS